MENRQIKEQCLRINQYGYCRNQTGRGTDGMFPIYSPGAGTPYTHLNSSLLRSIEIQKFNDQNGTASISLLNKYQDLPAEKQQNPYPVYGKKCFNVMEIRQNETVVDGYYYENVWQYFDPIVRINFCGRIDVSSMTPTNLCRFQSNR